MAVWETLWRDYGRFSLLVGGIKRAPLNGRDRFVTNVILCGHFRGTDYRNCLGTFLNEKEKRISSTMGMINTTMQKWLTALH